MITGGFTTNSVRTSSAEVFNPDTGVTCSVEDLPIARDQSSLCHGLVCGGYNDHGDWGEYKTYICRFIRNSKLNFIFLYFSLQKCTKFENGAFSNTALTLAEQRFAHVCWELENGEVLLMGGLFNTKTSTERVSADGSSATADFPLAYNT